MYAVHASGESHVIIRVPANLVNGTTPPWRWRARRAVLVGMLCVWFWVYDRRTHAGTNKQKPPSRRRAPAVAAM